MIAPVLLALAMAGPPDGAAASAAPTPPEVAPPAPASPGPVPPAAPAGVPATASSVIPAELSHPPTPSTSVHGWRHALALGAQETSLQSKEGSEYGFRSATIGYLGSVGSRGAFLHASVVVPLQARQDGATYTTADYYRHRGGGDLLFGFNWRWSMQRGLEAEAGPGLHASFIYLPGKDGYRDFSAAPLGLGAAGVLSWDTGARQLGRAVTVGTYLGAAYDLRDPAHANDLAHGWMLRGGLSVGLGGRP
jgi:hypothetical protein